MDMVDAAVESPDNFIRSGFPSNRGNMDRSKINVHESNHRALGEVPIEGEPHAGTKTNCRSRSAANAGRDPMSFSVEQGKPARIFS